MIRGHPKKGGDDDLDLYRANATRSTGIILTIAASLVIGWLGIVEPIRTDLEEFVNREYMRAPEEALTTVMNKIQQREGIPVDKDTALLFATDNEARAFLRAEQDLEDAKSRYETVDAFRVFNFFGFAIPVPWISGALAWCIIACFLPFFVHFKRQELYGRLMKAKSLYEDSADSRESAKLRDFAGISPFWLAPVHWHGRNVNEHSEIREALGWDKLQESLATVLSALFVVGLMLMMMRVAYVGYLITDDHARLRKLLNLSVDSGAFTWMVMVDVFLALFLILTVIGCFAWFFGWTFMTGTLGIAIGNRSFSRRRRALVGTVITAVPLLIAVALARTIKWPQDQTDTGEGRSYTEHDLARGFYKNVLESIAPGNNASKGGAVHYIDGEGRSRTLVGRQLGKSAGPPRLEWVKNEADIVRNLVFQDFTYAVELNVLEAIRSGDEEQILQARKILNEACEFQLGGELKKGARPHISFRLLDMMVRIYSMGGQVEEIRALGGRAMRLASGSEQLRTIDRKRLRTRAELWTKEAIYEEAGDHSGWAFYVKERRLHIDLTDAIS